MADEKTKPKDFPAQADQQRATDTAVKQGTEGAQAQSINKELAEKRKDG